MPNINQKQWEKEEIQELVRGVQKEVPRIRADLNSFAKSAYNQFTKAPVDTGLSKEETEGTAILENQGADLPYLSIKVSISGEPETYAQYFIRGRGSNAKYGRRDVLQKALQLFSNKYGLNIKVNPTVIN